MKGHAAHSSWERCIIEGQYVNHRAADNYEQQEIISSGTGVGNPTLPRTLKWTLTSGRWRCVVCIIISVDYIDLICQAVVRHMLLILKV